MQEMDLVFVHVEAPDEAGHSGKLPLKLQAIEDFDAKVVGPMVAGLEKLGDFRLLVLCDHLTPLALRTHTDEPVPYVIYDPQTIRGLIPRPRPRTVACSWKRPPICSPVCWAVRVRVQSVKFSVFQSGLGSQPRRHNPSPEMIPGMGWMHPAYLPSDLAPNNR